MSEANGADRLDRMEKIIERPLDAHLLLEQSQKNLLRSQVLLLGAQQQTAAQMANLERVSRDLAESQRHGDERLNALIAIVDALIRRQQP